MLVLWAVVNHLPGTLNQEHSVVNLGKEQVSRPPLDIHV